MNVLVTGGSGFIGTNLVSDLLAAGHVVSICDKNPSERHPRLCTAGDVRDRAALTAALKGIDTVYHLAAEHRDDVRPISLYYDVNVGGAENLVYAAEQNGVRRIVFTSSVAIYGLNVGTPDEQSPGQPFNDYGKSKYESEKVLKAWAEKDASRCLVIVRLVVIFGEKNRGNVYNLLNQIANGRFLMVGNGNNRKSMAYVLNTTRFLVNLLGANPGVHVYNYADKPDLTVRELVQTAFHTLGKGKKAFFRVPYPLGLLAGYIFDLLAGITGKTFPISSIRIKKFAADTTVSAQRVKALGFTAPYSLTEGLQRMIKSEFLKGDH